MLVRSASILAAITLTAAPVIAQTSNDGASPSVAAAAKPAKPAKPRKICRSEAAAASRVRTSVCKTAEEWEHDANNSDHVAGLLGR